MALANFKTNADKRPDQRKRERPASDKPTLSDEKVQEYLSGLSGSHRGTIREMVTAELRRQGYTSPPSEESRTYHRALVSVVSDVRNQGLDLDEIAGLISLAKAEAEFEKNINVSKS